MKKASKQATGNVSKPVLPSKAIKKAPRKSNRVSIKVAASVH
jgi:hypothetical protein